jgi:hypothetical protein
MGVINTDHRGSGGAITLSSDGTSLLLDGTAVGGGADLYAANESSPTAQPSATGTNAVAMGDTAVASGDNAFALGNDTDATGLNSLALGKGAQAVSTRCIAIGLNSSASADRAITIGNNGNVATATYATSIGSGSDGSGSTAAGSGSVALSNARAGGADSLAAVIANNTSTYGATGANSVAIGYQAKATGSGSVALGTTSGGATTASGAYSFATQTGTASGTGSTSLGDSSASGTYATSIGIYASASGRGSLAFNGGSARGYNQIAFSTGQYSGSKGQGGIYPFRASTTDATATTMTTQGVLSNGNATVSVSGTNNNQLLLQNESAVTFNGTVVCREDASDGDDYAGWEIKGVIMRGTGESTTVLGAGIVNPLYHTSALANATVTLSADTTNGCLKIQVTGVASTNLFWNSSIYTSEVVNT